MDTDLHCSLNGVVDLGIKQEYVSGIWTMRSSFLEACGCESFTGRIRDRGPRAFRMRYFVRVSGQRILVNNEGKFGPWSRNGSLRRNDPWRTVAGRGWQGMA